MLLLLVGAATAVAGALNALARRDLKRLVAYSSVENLGVVALGLGLGLLGRAHGWPLLAFLGFAGALLHVLNHGLMKSLLFLLAGDVVAAAGTGTLDRMGGLARRMPRTAAAFLVGAVAISGLPPGNGFAMLETKDSPLSVLAVRFVRWLNPCCATSLNGSVSRAWMDTRPALRSRLSCASGKAACIA